MTDIDVGVRLNADGTGLVGQVEQSEEAIEGLTAAITRTNAASDALARQQAQSKAQIDSYRQSVKNGEITQEEFNRAVLASRASQNAAQAEYRQSVQELTRLRQATTGAAQSQRAMAAASTNLGFQVQDITQGLALGVNPLVVFGQQAGQTAFALSGLGGTAGRVGSFFAGPFGSLILAGVTVVGLLASELLFAEEKLQDAEFATDRFSDAQSALGTVIDLTTGKIRDQAGALVSLARAQILAGQIEARAARREAQGRFSEFPASSTTITGGQFNSPTRVSTRQNAEGEIIQNFVNLAEGADGETIGQLADEAVQGLNRLAESGAITEEVFLRAATAVSDFNVATQNLSTFEEAEAALNGDQGALSGFLRPTRQRRPSNAAARAAAREQRALASFLDRSSGRIDRITDRFQVVPRLITQAARASADLDEIIGAIDSKAGRDGTLPEGFEELREQALRAQTVIESGLAEPFQRLIEAGQVQNDIQRLILAGREDEAIALQRIQQLQDRVGEVTRDQREAILGQVQAERQLTRELQARAEIVGSFAAATDDARANVEALLSGRASGGDFLDNLNQSFNDLNGRLLTERLFGAAFRDLDEFVEANTGIETGVDIMEEGTERAGSAATSFAVELERASRRVAGTFGGSITTGETPNGNVFDEAFAGLASDTDQELLDQQRVATEGILVIARQQERGVFGLRPAEFFRGVSDNLTAPLTAELQQLLGPELGAAIGGALSNALAGFAQAGEVGGVIGLGRGLAEALGGSQSLLEQFDGALGGASQGRVVSQIIGGSSTLGAIGGAAGSFLPIPGGSLIGALGGSLLGSIFGGSRRGSSTITSVDGNVSTSGNSTSRREASVGLAGSVQQGLQDIIQALNATAGAFAVSIGLRNDEFRVDTSGRGVVRQSRGARNFGEDERGAINFAISDAIADGAVQGISQAVQRALRSDSNVERALEEALRVQDLENALSGVSGAIGREVEEFARLANERLRLARQYGLDVRAVEELNQRERIALRDRIERESFGSLTDLLDRLRFGDLFEGSAVDQRGLLLTEIQDATQRALDGEDGAADELAQLLEQFRSVSLDVFGTTGGFADDRNFIIENAESVIASVQDTIDQAFGDNIQVPDRSLDLAEETNDILAQILAEIRAGGGSFFPGFPGNPPFELNAAALATRSNGLVTGGSGFISGGTGRGNAGNPNVSLR